MIEDYYDALERLINNEPLILPKDSKINNDTVALEAARKRGSIKKNREVFKNLITKINKACKQKNLEKNSYIRKIDKLKEEIEIYKSQYENILNRELMLYKTIKDLSNEIEELKKDKFSVANNF